MTKRRARGLGKRGGRSSSRARGRSAGRRVKRWALPVLLAIAATVGFAALWPRAQHARRVPPAPAPLSAADRRRATTPLSQEARAWLRSHRADVREVARRFDVSPVALGGIVAAEKTLLTGRVDAVGEGVFQGVIGSLGEDDLERWAEEQERDFRRRGAQGGGRPTLLTPYLWTLGPAQVSFRLAILYEPEVARRTGRPKRSVRQVLDAVTSTPGNLEYAAALLGDAQRAYADVAGVDIADDPGLLATLYHLGSPTVRARRLASDNAARASRGDAPDPPRMNWYGAFVDHHAEEIAELLGLNDARDG